MARGRNDVDARQAERLRLREELLALVPDSLGELTALTLRWSVASAFAPSWGASPLWSSREYVLDLVARLEQIEPTLREAACAELMRRGRTDFRVRRAEGIAERFTALADEEVQLRMGAPRSSWAAWVDVVVNAEFPSQAYCSMPTRLPALVAEAARRALTSWRPDDSQSRRLANVLHNGGPEHVGAEPHGLARMPGPEALHRSMAAPTYPARVLTLALELSLSEPAATNAAALALAGHLVLSELIELWNWSRLVGQGRSRLLRQSKHILEAVRRHEASLDAGVQEVVTGARSGRWCELSARDSNKAVERLETRAVEAFARAFDALHGADALPTNAIEIFGKTRRIKNGTQRAVRLGGERVDWLSESAAQALLVERSGAKPNSHAKHKCANWLEKRGLPREFARLKIVDKTDVEPPDE